MQVKGRRGRVASALRRSRTVFGSLAALGGVLTGYFNEAVSLALEAAAQFSMLAPIAGIATALGVDAKHFTFGMAIAGIGLALFARLDDARTGANAR